MNRPNIPFLMVDCMRADILWDRRRYPSMPNLDRLCTESSVFTQAIAATTVTTPSVATMLTGRPPAEHGIRSLLGCKLRPEVPTLAELRAQFDQDGPDAKSADAARRMTPEEEAIIRDRLEQLGYIE